MKIVKGFASDNYSGVHPDLLSALQRANSGHAAAYGNDPFTVEAIASIKGYFGAEKAVFFVANGTGANCLGLKAVTSSYNSIICAQTAHINVDECAAPEKNTGCKLISIPTNDGKIRKAQILPYLTGFGDQHHAQPKVISISQPTEVGTVYSTDEVKDLADLAHSHQMFLHIDGARLANAAVTLNKSFREITFDCGADILSFGGTKNGMLFGEAVVFASEKLSQHFQFLRKQGMQLISKMRFIAVQFTELLANDLWKRNAAQANRMAQLLAAEVSKIAGITITQKVEANGVFAIIPKECIAELQQEYFFYVWDEQTSEVRWMCSFDTTEEDVYGFVELLKKVIKQ